MEDPTNEDTEFLRNRLRAILQRGYTEPWTPAAQEHPALRENPTAADHHVQRSSEAASQSGPAPGGSNRKESITVAWQWRRLTPAAAKSLSGVLQRQQGGLHAAKPSPAADALRLVHACHAADALLASRAEQTLLDSVQPAEGPGSALLLLERLCHAGNPVAVSVLAAVMQVRAHSSSCFYSCSHCPPRT